MYSFRVSRRVSQKKKNTKRTVSFGYCFCIALNTPSRVAVLLSKRRLRVVRENIPPNRISILSRTKSNFPRRRPQTCRADNLWFSRNGRNLCRGASVLLLLGPRPRVSGLKAFWTTCSESDRLAFYTECIITIMYNILYTRISGPTHTKPLKPIGSVGIPKRSHSCPGLVRSKHVHTRFFRRNRAIFRYTFVRPRISRVRTLCYRHFYAHEFTGNRFVYYSQQDVIQFNYCEQRIKS